MGERPSGLTLERIDTKCNYEPGDCRWATRADQSRNQRRCVHLEYNGKRKTVEELGREIGKHPTTLRERIKRGYPLEMILSPRSFLTGRISPLDRLGALELKL